MVNFSFARRSRRDCVAIRYAGQGVREAAETVVHGQLRRMRGEGGVIVVGRDGTIAMPFNSRGMLRGSIDAQGRLLTDPLEPALQRPCPAPPASGRRCGYGPGAAQRVRRCSRGFLTRFSQTSCGFQAYVFTFCTAATNDHVFAAGSRWCARRPAVRVPRLPATAATRTCSHRLRSLDRLAARLSLTRRCVFDRP